MGSIRPISCQALAPVMEGPSGTASVAQLAIEVPDVGPVSAVSITPPRPIACYVLAHGAGAGMRHPFMEAVAARLAQRDVATLRFQFPSMERGLRRADRPAVAMATVRAAIATAHRCHPDMPLIAGGKSFGGRMTSQAQAADPLPGVRGLAFLGFPLHQAGTPSTVRADHLDGVTVPMLFLRGMRDALADAVLLDDVVKRLGARATLKWFEGADHAFHVPARSGRTDADVLDELTDSLAGWIASVLAIA